MRGRRRCGGCLQHPGRFPAGQTGTAASLRVLTKRRRSASESSSPPGGSRSNGNGHRGGSAGPAAMIVQRTLVNYFA